MPCPHCKITIIKRSNNESAVSAAAYQSGEKLFSEYDQEQKYYPYKNEVTHKEIMLPPHVLQSLLQEERRSREQLPPGDFKAHIAALRDGLIETEARRIVREMKRHDTPNSPNKTHFMVELSPAFMQLAATKDTDRLFSMLPYKTLAFSKIEGRHGTYALIDKGENRDRKIRKPRPSIRAQLKADKAKTAPKKAAAKTKNHDMEV